MSDFYFALLDETGNTARFQAGPATGGPWAGHLQHGGPPNALAVAVAEQALRAHTGRDDFVALRLAAEFVGPVPVDVIETRTRVVRAARSAALVEVIVAAGGRDCLVTRVWFVRTWDTSSVAAAPAAPAPRPAQETPLELEFAYGTSLEWHFVEGRMKTPGPAAAWVRPTLPLLPGHEYSGLSRVALIADSASGISAELDWDRWSFINVDLDLHLARPITGEWLLMEAATQVGPQGSALTRSTLSDGQGVVGAGLQTLVLATIST